MKNSSNKKLLAAAVAMSLTVALVLLSTASTMLASKADDPSTQARADSNSPASNQITGSTGQESKDSSQQPSSEIANPQPPTVSGPPQGQQPTDNTGQTPIGMGPGTCEACPPTTGQGQTALIGQQQQATMKGGKGNTLAQQQCAGVQSVFECNQFVKNISNHHTTIKQGGSNIVIGTPVGTANGATPTILFIPGVGYVELTGIQDAGNGQATINYVVLVPTK